jgi:oxygen-independent coproporphyrinogen-3 oxidase
MKPVSSAERPPAQAKDGARALPATAPEATETARTLAGGIALYIHIPFCQTRCPYCDFNTYAGLGHLIPKYLGALQREIRAWGLVLGRPTVNTVFLGGGTPSLLTPTQIGELLDSVKAAFAVHPQAEVSAEANPDDVTTERMAAFRALGVNRLSMGVQSLDDGLLNVLGRRHDSAQAEEAFRLMRSAGCSNISMDLMYGLPAQTMDQWRQTVRRLLEMAPEHVSAYCLTLEEGTPLASSVKAGRVPDPDQDLAADMYLWAEDALAAEGYLHYEISNWARPGFESRHNLTYWRNLPYLGVGPGAHSFLGGYRFANLDPPPTYIQRVSGWAVLEAGGAVPTLDVVLTQRQGAVADVEAVDRRLEMAETVMLGLRLGEGVGVEAFRSRFGRELREVYASVLPGLEAAGLLEAAAEPAGGSVRLTDRGRLLGNEVFVRILGV